MSNAGESSNLELPAFTDCEERSLKVLDKEIEKLNERYHSLIEQTKKERDKKIKETGGYQKY